MEETNTMVVTECCDLMVVDEDVRFLEKLYTRLLIQGKQVCVQVGTGATCNIIRYEELVDATMMRETSQRLQLYDGTLVTPAGRIALEVQDAKNKKQYQCEFVVVRKAAVSLLGAQTSLKMGIVTFNYENVAITAITENSRLGSKDDIMRLYSDVFADEVGLL